MKKRFILTLTNLFWAGLLWSQDPSVCNHDDAKDLIPFESTYEILQILETFSWNLDKLPVYDAYEANTNYEPYSLSELITGSKLKEKTELYEGIFVNSMHGDQEIKRGECFIESNNFPCKLKLVRTFSEFNFYDGKVFELIKNHFLFLGPNDSLFGGFVETIWNDPDFHFYNYYVFPLDREVIEQTPVINVFPNPTTGIININIINLSYGEFSIDLIGQAGETVMSIDKGTATKSLYERQVSLTDLPSNIYYLRLKMSEKTYTQKLILN